MDTHQSSFSHEKQEHPTLEYADEGNRLWDEYKYRHDLIWRHLIRSTLALVALVTVGYSTAFKPTVPLVIVAWVVALGYWVVTLFAVEPELRLLSEIRKKHRERQKLCLDLDLKKVETKPWVVTLKDWVVGLSKTKQTNDTTETAQTNDTMKWGKIFFVDSFSCRVGTYVVLLLVATLLVGLVALLDNGLTLR